MTVREGDFAGKVVDMKDSESNRQKTAQTQVPAGMESVSKTDSTFGASLSVDGGKLSASIGGSMSRSTEVRTGATAEARSGTGAIEINQDLILSDLKAKGVDVEKGPIPLDKVSEVIMERLGINVDDLKDLKDKEREQRIEQIANQLALVLRAEKGGEVRAGMSAGASVTASADGTVKVQGHIAGELIATGGAMVGGLASLAGGSAKVVGAAAGALGRGLGLGSIGPRSTSPAKRFEGVAVLPTISEYRVSKVEESASNYERAVGRFWKVPPMAGLRSEIEERAQKAGLSISDAMAKMKPDGEWADIHARFVKEVAASPEAIQAKVGMDQAIKSWIRQYDHGSEELLNADLEDNPNMRKAKNRVEATKGKMEELAGQTPVFGGETQSHAERLQAAVQAIMERLKEMLMSVRDKIFGKGQEAAPTP